MLKSFLIVVLLSCVAQINSETLPAFIWGGKSAGHFPALHSLSGDEFSTFVKSQNNGDSLTVVFVEESLSVEDLSQCRVQSQSCFGNLQKIEKKTYLTSVDDPVNALKSLNDGKRISLTTGDDLNNKLNEIANEKLVFVYLDEVEGKEDFVKHDELIAKLYNLIASKRENVIAIYTGRSPSFVYSRPLIRKTRSISAKQNETILMTKFFHDPRVIVALTNMRVITTAGTEVVTGLDALTVTTNFTKLTMALDAELKVGTHEIVFKLVLSGGTWEAREIYYNNLRFMASAPIDAYEERSFGCGNITITNAKTYVVLENFQIQPFFNETGPFTAESAFAGHNDCVGYFSPVIWGTIFIVILLLSILSYGFMMIMDIKTMDRFDDPKGKTITINAQE